MNRIILNDRNKIKISTILLSTIIISCLFMIFGETREIGGEEVLLADTVETTNYTYTVEFNDAGYEYNRPSEMKFGLYEVDATSPKVIVILKKNKCSRQTCNITFENVAVGNYIVKEIGDYGYNVTYQGTRIINDVDVKNVNIDLFDTKGNRVIDSVLAIKDINDNEILTTTTNLRTSTINLLRGQYTLYEKDSPKGYKRVKEVVFKVLDDGTLEINGAIKDKIELTKENISIKINLVNEYNEVVPDIKIELVNLYDGNISKTAFSGINDIEVNEEIDVDGEYKLKQLKEAFEYLNAEDVLFKFDKDNNIVINNKVQNTNRVVLVVHPAFYHITVDKKIEGEISQEEEFTFNMHIDDYNGIITSSKGDLNFNNGDATFKLIPNEEISIKVPTYSKYSITEDTNYEQKIEGANTGEVRNDIKISFTNIKVEEDIVVPAPITGINKVAYLLTGLLLALSVFLITLYVKKKKVIREK